jgi:tRNA A-37 threonylcarbamoyl transferase component Bud32
MKFNYLHKVVCLTRPDVRNQDPADLLSRVERAVASPSEIIKEITNRTEIKRTMRVNIAPWGDLCLHEFKWNLRRVAVSPFRLSRGERTWKFHDEIVRSGVFVPEPVLLLEIKTFLFTMKTYVATRWIDVAFSPGSLGLEEKIPESVDIQLMLFKCVDAIANLHNAGFIHGDLKWSNFLCMRNRDTDIALIDLDSLRKTSSVRMQGRDFARFLIPPKNYQLRQDMIDLLTERYLGKRGSSRLLERVIRAYAAKKKG